MISIKPMVPAGIIVMMGKGCASVDDVVNVEQWTG